MPKAVACDVYCMLSRVILSSSLLDQFWELGISMREPSAALFVRAAGVMPLKKHLTAGAAELKPMASAGIFSFYRHYASRCETAARNAPNEKMRAELSKMVHVWREFAAEHERMVRERRDIKMWRRHVLKGWM